MMNRLVSRISALAVLLLAQPCQAQVTELHVIRNAPALDEPLVARPGMMIGRVMTWDGRPVPRFTIEYVAYAVGKDGVRLTGQAEPNAVAQVEGLDGYYEIRLPEGSYGLVSGVTLPLLEGKQTFRFWAESPGITKLDFLEVQRGNPGVIKNFVWNVRSGGGAAFVASPFYGAALVLINATELIGNIASRPLAEIYSPKARVVLTFTPRSALIDGTGGRVLTRSLFLGELGSKGGTLRDIPFATYEVTAKLNLPDGSERMLNLASGPPDVSTDGVNRRYRWKSSAIVDFAALGHGGGESVSGEAQLFLGDSN